MNELLTVLSPTAVRALWEDTGGVRERCKGVFTGRPRTWADQRGPSSQGYKVDGPVSEAMGSLAWSPWLQKPSKEAWEHSGVCACGRTALFGQCMRCTAEELSEERAGFGAEGQEAQESTVLVGASEVGRVGRESLLQCIKALDTGSGARSNRFDYPARPKNSGVTEVRWSRGERLSLQKPGGWRGTSPGGLRLKPCSDDSPSLPWIVEVSRPRERT